MDKVSITHKIFFEDPFWIGLFESILDDQLSVCKVTFGSDQVIKKFMNGS